MEEAARRTELTLTRLGKVATGGGLVVRMNGAKRLVIELFGQRVSRSPQLVVTVRKLASLLERTIAGALEVTAQLRLVASLELLSAQLAGLDLEFDLMLRPFQILGNMFRLSDDKFLAAVDNIIRAAFSVLSGWLFRALLTSVELLIIGLRHCCHLRFGGDISIHIGLLSVGIERFISGGFLV